MGVSAILTNEITQHGTAYALGLVATAVNVNVAVAVPIQIVTTVRLF